MSGSTLELARMSGTWSEATDDCPDIKDEESIVNKLCSALLDSSEKLDRFLEQNHVRALFEHLRETIELDRLQFRRVSADVSGRSFWIIIKYLCKLANRSESYYKCISEAEWLRTIIVVETRRQRKFFAFHSNVVPRLAYLTRLESAVCPQGQGCTSGFFPSSDLLEGNLPRRSCETCALAKELKRGAHTPGVVLQRIETKDVMLEGNHARLGKASSQGEVYKVSCRKGIFARKQFPTYDVSHRSNNHEAIPLSRVYYDKEIEVAKEVSHPNIVHCFGFSEYISRPKQRFLQRNSAEYWNCELSVFMELLEGDLEECLLELDRVEDRFSFRESLHVLLQIAEAMEHLHNKNFVHGDLKPGNILISRLGMPHSEVNGKFYLAKVTDFGCIQRVDSSGAIVGSFNHAIGTRFYTAPEVLRCRIDGGAPPEQPQKIDVYSFGVLAYQVLTGVPITKLYANAGISELFEESLVQFGRPNFSFSRGVMKPDTDELQLRPNRLFNLFSGTCDRVSLDDNRSLLIPLIESCWASLPQDRPTFPVIRGQIQSLHTQILNEHCQSV